MPCRAVGLLVRGNAQAPFRGAQGGDRGVGSDRGKVVVVGERQVGLVDAEKLEGLGSFVLAD